MTDEWQITVGWVGLGKLGRPIAEYLATLPVVKAVRGHDVKWPSGMANVERAGSISELVAPAYARYIPDLVFVAVPTPHGPEYEGVTPLPDTRADFDYTALRDVLRQISDAARQDVTVVVVSTCLPGTYRTKLQPLPPRIRYLHSPSFISMGLVVPDFRDPEFWLIGNPGPSRWADDLHRLYRHVNNDRPIIETDVTTAEAIKVAYNTSISAKIAVANTWGEIAARLGIDADVISDTLGKAFRRVTSSAYTKAGMGDGGPCHPRDLIAMSWLARELGLSYDLFDALAEQRVEHTRWLAGQIPAGAVIFGNAFKDGTDLTDGSPARLLVHVLDEEQGRCPHEWAPDPTPGAYNVIASPQTRYRDVVWPVGSTVLDPFGIIEAQEGVHLIRPGRRPL